MFAQDSVLSMMTYLRYPRNLRRAISGDATKQEDSSPSSGEAGKLADLIVLNKDPLQDIRNTNTIRYVMKGGQMFEGDTLNEVWPQQKPLPELWWWKEKP